MIEAKNTLWDKCNNVIIGEKIRRDDSSTRSETDANIQDIITALKNWTGQNRCMGL